MVNLPRFVFATLAGVLLAATACAQSGTSDRAPIEFDSKLSVACRDVTPKEFAEANPDSKILEAMLRISANFSIHEDSVDSLVYRLRLPEEVELADYVPKTELGSNASSIDTSHMTSSRQGLVVSFEAGGKVSYKLPVGLEVGGGLTRSSKEESGGEVQSGVQMKLLPPKELILAAGTENRGSTLYFKLKPFNQITLEGEKEFACLLIVPKDWAGACLQLECQALAKQNQAVGVEQVLGVGLYPRGDLAARKRVEKMARQIEGRKSDPSVFAVNTPEAPSVPTQIEPATIKLQRRDQLLGSAYRHTLWINGEKIGLVGNGATKTFTFTPATGKTVIYVEAYDPFFQNPKSNEVTLEVPSGGEVSAYVQWVQNGTTWDLQLEANVVTREP